MRLIIVFFIMLLAIKIPAVNASENKTIGPGQEGKYLQNIRQLTSEGISGEGYFSRDMKKIIFQSILGDHPYYQIYTMDIDGGNQALVSGGKGKTTCSYFRPDGKKIIYASTMHNPASGTEPPMEEKRYQWEFDPDKSVPKSCRMPISFSSAESGCAEE